MEQIQSSFKFTDNENQVMKFWQDNDVYTKICEKNKNGEIYNYIDGPPFVSSDNLHFGHVHIGMMKSVLVNYMNMHGYNVLNKIGYDCHGLPIEQVVSKMLNLNSNKEIKEFGLAKYNAKCEEVINSFSGSWQTIYNRIGRFVNFDNQYKTMDFKFMETCWWVFKQLWEKDLVYKGYRIMPYSTECGTPISASEASGDDVYKEVSDPAIYVKFQIKNQLDDKINTYIIAWTTTPWTLPSNLALAVNQKIKYVKVKDLKSGDHYIMALNCLYNVYNKKETTKGFEIVSELTGDELVGLEYVPILPYYQERTFKVILADFVTEESGTGIVHLAAGFGQDDFDACIGAGVVTVEDVGNYCPVDENGRFISPVNEYLGEKVISTNNKIIERLKKEGKLVKKEMFRHKYPHCWRTDTPLIYKAVSSFFIKVTTLREKMVENNKKSTWVPENVGNVRFKQWLENAKDWGVSRSRFFGTPIPVWVSDDGEEMICIGSVEELAKLANLDYIPDNLHPQYIQNIQIPSQQGKGMLKWNNSVCDCWFESGCVPFGQLHYPFENSDAFDNKEFLCDFICEGLDQTRGWFYTLTVLSTALFDKPVFKNVICSGLILADDGKKFSKRLGNFVSPIGVCDEFSADALRMYLVGSPAAHGEAFKFDAEKIKEILAKYYQWFNALKFLLEHTIKFQKDGNTFDVNSYKLSDNIMDKWIISRVGTLLINVKSAMDNYTFYKVKQEILDFIEDLTNWYIKFNRNRLRGRYCDNIEQGKALSTLYYVMLHFTIIAAPFAPFLTETMYLTLKTLLPKDAQNISVHLCNYSTVNDFEHNDNVERSMKRLQSIVVSVRALRMKTTNCTSAKAPIKHVTIANDDQEFLDDLKLLERYMREEINALNISYKSSCGVVKYTIVPNQKELGQKFRGKANDIKNELSKLTQDDIINYTGNTENGLTVFNEVLFEPLFSIIKQHELELNENELGDINGQTSVVINFSQDEEVLEAYIMRLFIVSVQQMRKKTKLRPWNKIGIYYKTDNDLINKVIEKRRDDIKQELLYDVYKMENRNMDEREIVTSDCNICDGVVLVTITDIVGDFI